MVTPNWQLQTPLSAVIFDCDGTLTTIEGIDELAKNNGASDIVQGLTRDAMGKSGMNPELYEKRLALVNPTQAEVIALGRQYIAHQVPDIDSVIQIFKRLNKAIYIVSAGLYPAVAVFGKHLQVHDDNIYAVKIDFDAEGRYLSFDKGSALTYRDGKREIVREIKKHHPEVMCIGDGLNDYAVYDLVTRFVGYGGAYYRDNIASLCQFYIKSLSMASLLPLALTQNEAKQLTSAELTLYQRGLSAIESGDVINKKRYDQ